MGSLRRGAALVPLVAAFGIVAALPGSAQGAHAGLCASALSSGAFNVIYAEAGTPTVGTSGADLIIGTSGDDVIAAGNGDDLVCGLGGADRIDGGNGADRLLGDVGCAGGCDGRMNGTGADTVEGGNGDDTLWGDNGDDTLSGGNGDDRLIGANPAPSDADATQDGCDGGRGLDTATSCDATTATEA